MIRENLLSDALQKKDSRGRNYLVIKVHINVKVIKVIKQVVTQRTFYVYENDPTST